MLAGEKSNQQNAVRVALQFFQKALDLVNSKSIEINEETEVRLYYDWHLRIMGLVITMRPFKLLDLPFSSVESMA